MDSSPACGGTLPAARDGLLAAGYAMYGAATRFVLAVGDGNGVHGFGTPPGAPFFSPGPGEGEGNSSYDGRILAALATTHFRAVSSATDEVQLCRQKTVRDTSPQGYRSEGIFDMFNYV